MLTPIHIPMFMRTGMSTAERSTATRMNTPMGTSTVMGMNTTTSMVTNMTTNIRIMAGRRTSMHMATCISVPASPAHTRRE
jgi:hypothetical protein